MTFTCYLIPPPLPPRGTEAAHIDLRTEWTDPSAANEHANISDLFKYSVKTEQIAAADKPRIMFDNHKFPPNLYGKICPVHSTHHTSRWRCD